MGVLVWMCFFGADLILQYRPMQCCCLEKNINSIAFSHRMPKTSVLSPTRRYIREGILLKLGRRGLKKYTWWLFNDLIVYGVSGTKVHSVHGEVRTRVILFYRHSPLFGVQGFGKILRMAWKICK